MAIKYNSVRVNSCLGTAKLIQVFGEELLFSLGSAADLFDQCLNLAFPYLELQSSKLHVIVVVRRVEFYGLALLDERSLNGLWSYHGVWRMLFFNLLLMAYSVSA